MQATVRFLPENGDMTVLTVPEQSENYFFRVELEPPQETNIQVTVAITDATATGKVIPISCMLKFINTLDEISIARIAIMFSGLSFTCLF